MKYCTVSFDYSQKADERRSRVEFYTHIAMYVTIFSREKLTAHGHHVDPNNAKSEALNALRALFSGIILPSAPMVSYNVRKLECCCRPVEPLFYVHPETVQFRVNLGRPVTKVRSQVRNVNIFIPEYL